MILVKNMKPVMENKTMVKPLMVMGMRPVWKVELKKVTTAMIENKRMIKPLMVWE